MKYSVFPLVVSLSFVPQWVLAQEGPQLQINGSLKFGWQKTEEKFVGPPAEIEEGMRVDANLGGLVYGSFDGGLSYGLQFWLPVVDSQEEGTLAPPNAVRRDAGLAAYVAGNGWQLSAGHMDDAYRAALGSLDVGETVGDLPAKTLLDLGANVGFLRYTGGPSLRFDLTYSDFTLYSSISDSKLAMPGGPSGPTKLDRPVVAVGLRWQKETGWGNVFAAAAFQTSEFEGNTAYSIAGDPSFHGVSAGLEVGGFSFKISDSEGPVNYFLHVADVRAKYRGASVEYSIDGWSIGANYGRQISTNSFVNGVGRGVWVGKQLPNDTSISASWSHTHFDESPDGAIDRDAMSIGIIKKF